MEKQINTQPLFDLSLEEAIALMVGSIRPDESPEAILTEEALGRILAEDVFAPIDQPPFDRSPLDGYALRASDTVGASPESPVCLRVVGQVCAGAYTSHVLQPGEAVRIMTGAPIPSGSDCILRQEDTDCGEAQVNLFAELSPWDNYCYLGEDFSKGTLLLKKGSRLDHIAAGLLASCGLSSVSVRRLPRISLLSTGDELVTSGTPLAPGKIYNSNLTALAARLTSLGIPPVEAMHVADDCDDAVSRIRQLLCRSDLLITTGGVSVGKKDIFHQVLPALGAEKIFYGVKLKPGTPAIFSLCSGVPILSLSGNPFAALATFELLARPLLAVLSGDSRLYLTRVPATMSQVFDKKSPGRRFVRAHYCDGRISFPREGHSSGMLSSMLDCNCLIDIPAGTDGLVVGQQVSVLLLCPDAASHWPDTARFGGDVS